jgi:hypothetical protein
VAEKAASEVLEIMGSRMGRIGKHPVNAAHVAQSERVCQPISAATPGSVLPSIHSRNAPPAVET